jgi:Fe2+ or Zn2+ uptake regulation protein
MKRNTFQRTLIFNTLQQLGHATADDVHKNIVQTYPTISKATVYRNLNSLFQEDLISKVCMPNGSDYFDKTVQNHYHFKCNRCSRIFDLKEVPYMDSLNHIQKNGCGHIQAHALLFLGICADCLNCSQKKGK